MSNMLLEKSEEIAPEGIKRLSQSRNKAQLWMCLAVKSKVRYRKEKYCVRTWNVRSINQGKLEVVKQEMARVDNDILGISKLKWTWMGEFNSDDHYIYYRGQESFRRNGIVLRVNERVQNAVLECSLKNDRMNSIHSRVNHSVSQ